VLSFCSSCCSSSSAAFFWALFAAMAALIFFFQSTSFFENSSWADSNAASFELTSPLSFLFSASSCCSLVCASSSFSSSSSCCLSILACSLAARSAFSFRSASSVSSSCTRELSMFDATFEISLRLFLICCKSASVFTSWASKSSDP